jgi:hypothetical protein
MRSVDFPRSDEGSNNLDIKQEGKRFPRTCVRDVGRLCCPSTYFDFASFVATRILSRPTGFLIEFFGMSLTYVGSDCVLCRWTCAIFNDFILFLRDIVC